MRLLFEEYGDVIFSSVCVLVVLGIFLSSFLNQTLTVSANSINRGAEEVKLYEANPVLIDEASFVVKDVVVNQGDDFNFYDYIKAYNTKGEDIRDYVSLYNTIDTFSLGEKQAAYILRYNGQTMLGKAKVFVVGDVS